MLQYADVGICGIAVFNDSSRYKWRVNYNLGGGRCDIYLE